MKFYQEDDNSVDSIDFVNNDTETDGLQQLAKELDEADQEALQQNQQNQHNPNAFLDVSEMTIPGQYQARDRPVGRLPATLKKTSSIRMSALPEDIRETAMNIGLDRNQDGDLSVGEIAFALRDLENKRKSNSWMKKTVLGFIVLLVAMVVCIFAASLTAARLSKDFDVSPATGLALAKNAKEPTVMKTHSARVRKEGLSIAELSNKELGLLEEVVLEDGDLRFVVKGYSRDPFDAEKKVILLIEGGTVTYDEEGILEATGNAKLALEAVYGLDAFDDEGRRGRRLVDAYGWLMSLIG
jgi:hypothetical protein